ncbi:MAG: hypothetical protein AAAB19_31500, partial [Rhizobium sp.]
LIAFDDLANGGQDLFHGRFTHYTWLSHIYPRYPLTTTGWRGACTRITMTLEYPKGEKNQRESNKCSHAQFCYPSVSEVCEGF